MKTALFVLAGICILIGGFQFYGVSQLQSFQNTFLAPAIETQITQKEQLGTIFLIIGFALGIWGAKMDHDDAEKSEN